jgi:hypothetical protein
VNDRKRNGIARLVPLAGVGYAALAIAGDLTIGRFPDSSTSTSSLASFYAAHHVRVAAGGMLLAWSTLLLGVFGAALWDRARSVGSHPIVTAVALVGTGAAVATGLQAAATYWITAHVSTEAATTPAALQAWHIAGSEGAFAGGVALLLLASAAAGLGRRAVPAWLAWLAIVLGLLQLTPLGFLASMAFLAWAAAAGITMTLRPRSSWSVAGPDPALESR